VKTDCWKHSSPLLLAGLVLHLLWAPLAQAVDQVRVLNVRFAALDEQVVVSYDLEGPPDKVCKVRLVLRREGDPGYRYKPKYVAGDVGGRCRAGKELEIRWDIAREFPKGLEGRDFYFEVEAELRKGGLGWILAGAGIALAGGVLALGGGGSSDGGGGSQGNFPQPPGRP